MTELREKDGKLDTKSMLEENFLSGFKREGGNVAKAKAIVNGSKSVASGIVESKPIVGNTEELLISAYDTRDELINSFSEIQIGTPLSDSMKTSINRVGSIIRGLGGEIEEFDPLAHMSGLNTPNMDKYASRVIENTVDSYSLGQVEDAHLEEGSIIVTFAGEVGDIKYSSTGTITPNSRWLGTEAIDYIYTPGAGKMSVKTSDENGKWVDHSDDYNISWELLEDNICDREAQKNIETKEEEADLTQNDVNDGIDMDFPIEEK